ncbi:hypothetical protein Dda_8879 [Drechslerella dactyloides]|uniref:Uncharacterized protein n=1 Tax=Drechslerella dactyloides TaxID=74499 RepID=A0AAD6IQ56_DREDA|nr:hypothetical protein Dda_8879 [Drechslerella dactyloides]
MPSDCYQVEGSCAIHRLPDISPAGWSQRQAAWKRVGAGLDRPRRDWPPCQQFMTDRWLIA